MCADHHGQDRDVDVSSDSAATSQAAAPSRFLTRGVKAAIAISVVVILAVAAGGAYAYSDRAAQQKAIAARAAAITLESARTRLDLAEESALRVQVALSALAAQANGMADANTVTALSAAVAEVKK